MNNHLFKIKGENTTPERLDAAILGKVIADLSKVAKALDADSMFAVTGINAGSVQIEGVSSAPLQETFEQLTEKAFDKLSNVTLGVFRSLKNTLGKNELSLLLKDKLVINENTYLPEPVIYKRRTTLYGTICEAGGLSKPYIKLKTTEGIIIKCHAESELIQAMAKDIFQKVSITGTQRQNAETGAINDFSIDYFHPWKRLPMAKAMEQAAQDFGEFFRNINPDEWAEDIRKDG